MNQDKLALLIATSYLLLQIPAIVLSLWSFFFYKGGSTSLFNNNFCYMCMYVHVDKNENQFINKYFKFQCCFVSTNSLHLLPPGAPTISFKIQPPTFSYTKDHCEFLSKLPDEPSQRVLLSSSLYL